MASTYQRFLDLHRGDGVFIMPNPFDVGSARILASMGFPALATTSSGHAATLGRHDQHVRRHEFIEHVASIASAVDVPLNADSERLYADDSDGIAETVALLAEAGAAGCSIEDYDPASRSIDRLDLAVERVSAASEAAAGRMVLTARAENHLYGVDDIEDTIGRLVAYRRAGADCLYAPGLTDPADIGRVVEAVRAPVNVLLLPAGPSVGQLERLGVRRVSTGGALAWAGYGAVARAARELIDAGTSDYWAGMLAEAERTRAFGS